MTGKFIQTSLEHHMLELGSFTSFFSLPFELHYRLATPTWFTVLKGFVSEHNINLSNSTNIRLSPLRLHDRSLMDILRTDYDLTPADQISINRVRCYLEVFSLADIATGDGSRIRPCYKYGQRGDTISSWDWHEEQPSRHDVSRWKWALTLLVNQTQRLHTPLGKWLALPHHHWSWYYCMSTGGLYKKVNTSWTLYTQCRSATRSNPIFILDTLNSVAPTGLSLATVKLISDKFVVFEGTDYTDIDTIPPSISLTCDSYWILDDSTIKDKYCLPWVVQGLRDGKLLAICDGSYKPKLQSNGTTASWAIENPTSTDKIFGRVATSGITADAYRGELLGIYALLSAISYIERYNREFTTGILRIGCDNQQAGRVSSILDTTVSSSVKHFDLVKAIRRLHHSLKTNVQCYHIYGHQDKHTPYHILPRDAQINIMVDEAAQDYFDT